MLRRFQVRCYFSLHPYLSKNLQKLKLSPLTPLQKQVLTLSQANQNIFINENTGSGKTLCYLVPLINNILNKKRQNTSKPWGGLILTLTKELCIQIYRQIRLLDPDNLIKVSRIGSISHFSSIVQKLNKRQTISENLDQIIKENVVNTINWNNWDIVISTPHALLNAVNKNKDILKPQMVIIDEADLLLAIDQNLAITTKNILKKYIPVSNTQYILTASSFPPRINGKQSMNILNSMFQNIKILQSSNKHKLPPTLNVQFIDTTASTFQNRSKWNVLLDILSSRVNTKTIIFCNSAQTAEQITKKLNSMNKKSQYLGANLNTHQRTAAISDFQNEITEILVTTNLGSRGLDMNVGLVIEYEMATNVVDYINRAGRTARFGKQGTIISFVESGDKMLFDNIKDRLETGEPMDQIFSRKRSFSKATKKYLNKNDQQNQEQEQNNQNKL